MQRKQAAPRVSVLRSCEKWTWSPWDRAGDSLKTRISPCARITLGWEEEGKGGWGRWFELQTPHLHLIPPRVRTTRGPGESAFGADLSTLNQVILKPSKEFASETKYAMKAVRDLFHVLWQKNLESCVLEQPPPPPNQPQHCGQVLHNSRLCFHICPPDILLPTLGPSWTCVSRELTGAAEIACDRAGRPRVTWPTMDSKLWQWCHRHSLLFLLYFKIIF